MCPITVALGWFTARRDAVPGQTAVAAAIEQSTAVQLTASIVARKAAHGRVPPNAQCMARARVELRRESACDPKETIGRAQSGHSDRPHRVPC